MGIESCTPPINDKIQGMANKKLNKVFVKSLKYIKLVENTKSQKTKWHLHWADLLKFITNSLVSNTVMNVIDSEMNEFYVALKAEL